MTRDVLAIRRWRVVFAAGMLGLLLGGCGFHMQGSLDLPDDVDAIHVTYHDAYNVGQPPLVRVLRQRLREWHALGGPDAGAQLIIKKVSNRRRLVSISPINAGAVEYEMRAEVTFDYIVNGHTQLQDQQYAVTRHYSYNNLSRLAGDAERQDQSRQMQRRLAHRILYQIRNMNHQPGREK